MSLKNKRIVIIGGSSGIGLATAARALQEGAVVTVASRSTDKLQRAKQQLGQNLLIKSVDMRDENSLRALYSEIGQFDHLLTPGGEVEFIPFVNQPTESAKRSFESKFWGQHNAAKHAVPHLTQNGSITFYSGAASQRPVASFAIGAAINSAIESLGRALAVELAPIRVNTISPGLTDTPIFDYLSETERKNMFANYAATLPLKRVATADDIAKAAIYVMGNDYVTGSTLSVDGGYSFY